MRFDFTQVFGVHFCTDRIVWRVNFSLQRVGFFNIWQILSLDSRSRIWNHLENTVTLTIVSLKFVSYHIKNNTQIFITLAYKIILIFHIMLKHWQIITLTYYYYHYSINFFLIRFLTLTYLLYHNDINVNDICSSFTSVIFSSITIDKYHYDIYPF